MLLNALSVIHRLSTLFESLGIDYVLGGSIASIQYAEVRTTNDVDFLVHLESEHAKQIVESLGPQWYADEESISDAITRRDSFNVIEFETMFKADVFVDSGDAFVRQQLSRKVRVDLGLPGHPVPTYIVTAEDIILQKLRWYRMGGEKSDRQWRDVMGVLIFQHGKLDEDYLDRWADVIGVQDLLAQVREDSERPWNP